MITDTEALIQNIDAPRPKHRALTGYLRRKWSRNPYVLKRIVYNTDVSPYLGALPPELRARVPHEKIASVTAIFRDRLENFLISKASELSRLGADRIYDMSGLGECFDTSCILYARGINEHGVNPWSGLLGFVCKLSFPEINAHYALKLYYEHIPHMTRLTHGPWFEVATSLAANRAEPRDNVPMYMASLKYEKYLLSLWAGDSDDGIAERENNNKIFISCADEDAARNRRGGRRIDWGETFLSNYGGMSYPARKVYRQAINMDESAVCKSIKCAQNNLQKRDIMRALEFVNLIAWYYDNQALSDFMSRIEKQR